jgi:hypothetical protein
VDVEDFSGRDASNRTAVSVNGKNWKCDSENGMVLTYCWERFGEIWVPIPV